MQTIARLLVAFVAALFALPASAQTWTPPASFDTGWRPTQSFNLAPITNEPTDWARSQIPQPPDGTDLVRVTVTNRQYRVAFVATNVSPWPAWVRGAGLVQYATGHRPGLYQHGSSLYLAGHGWDAQAGWEARVARTSMGGSNFFYGIAPGQTVNGLRESFSDVLGVEVGPITPEWLTPDRRGAHSLFTTMWGGYTWEWGWNDGLLHPGWTHSPVSYTSVNEARLTGTVEYGSF